MFFKCILIFIFVLQITVSKIYEYKKGKGPLNIVHEIYKNKKGKAPLIDEVDEEDEAEKRHNGRSE